MYHKVEQTFYILSAMALMGIMFVFAPSTSKEVADFQQQILGQTEIAFKQVLGDTNLLEPLELVWSGIDDFYLAASEETLAMIPVVEVPDSVHLAFQKATTASVAFIAKGLENVLPPQPVERNLSQAEDPIYNIVPPFIDNDQDVYALREVPPLPISTMVVPSQEMAAVEDVITTVVGSGTVAGEYIELEQPVNDAARPWVTLQDNMTGQTYCVAIYNNEVNKYLGECKRDYY